MIAIVIYMKWLNKKAKHTFENDKPSVFDQCKEGSPPTEKSGFPPIDDKQSDPTRGQSIYVQKCAVCHGVDGQGRYEHDKYHRPALWGPNSFNYSAGLANTKKMAEFVKANMPWGAGGMLTEQEAWDVAAFIDECHCHPGRSLNTDGDSCELSPNCPSD